MEQLRNHPDMLIMEGRLTLKKHDNRKWQIYLDDVPQLMAAVKVANESLEHYFDLVTRSDQPGKLFLQRINQFNYQIIAVELADGRVFYHEEPPMFLYRAEALGLVIPVFALVLWQVWDLNLAFLICPILVMIAYVLYRLRRGPATPFNQSTLKLQRLLKQSLPEAVKIN